MVMVMTNNTMNYNETGATSLDYMLGFRKIDPKRLRRTCGHKSPLDNIKEVNEDENNTEVREV